MKAALHREFGPLDVLRVEDVPDPECGPQDVVLRVTAAGLNRLDVLQRQGPPLLPLFELPHIAGMDVVGEVADTGAMVTTVRRGDRVVVNPAIACGACPACLVGDDAMCPNTRVVGGNRAGGYAEWVSVPASHVSILPAGVDDLTACGLPTAYSTAWHALVAVGRLAIGETLLVHGAGSAVTQAAVDIARRAGARVIVTSRSPDKLAVALAHGADVAIDNRREDLVAAVREATAGRGVDIAFDHVGPALFQQSILCLRPRGRLVFCGTTTGTTATFVLPFAYHFGIRILGVDPYPREEFDRMLAYCLDAGFQPLIDSEFALDEARAAQARMEANEADGKIVLRP